LPSSIGGRQRGPVRGQCLGRLAPQMQHFCYLYTMALNIKDPRAERLAGLGYAALACDLHGEGKIISFEELGPVLSPLRSDPPCLRGRAGDALVRQRLADLYIRERVLDYIGQRIRSTVMSGAVPGPEGSIAKLAGAQLANRAAGLGVDLLGPRAVAHPVRRREDSTCCPFRDRGTTPPRPRTSARDPRDVG